MQTTRRQLIKAGIFTAVGTGLLKQAVAADFKAEVIDKDPWKGLKPGIASYTFRKFSLDDTIKALKKLDLKYISIKDFHIPFKYSQEERRAAIAKLTEAGITALSCGNVTMENDEANIRKAFDYARDCNFKTIVCSPHPGSMALLDKMVKEYDIRLAIHNHGPEDKRFPSPYDVWEAVKNYDNRIGLCIDVGHTARAKVNPAEAILKCKSRLYDLHFKDITTTEPTGSTIAAGRGVLDLASIMNALVKIKYPHLLSVEYESTPDEPLAPVAETVGYMKGMLAMKMKN